MHRADHSGDLCGVVVFRFRNMKDGSTMKIVGRNGNSLTVAEQYECLSLASRPNVLLVRCWNKTADEIKQLVERWTLQSVRIDAMLIVIDADKDTKGTAAAVESVSGAFPLIPVLVSGPADIPNWTRMLNGGLAYLKEIGVTQGSLICSSFETEFDSAELTEAMTGLAEWSAPVRFTSLRETPENIAFPEMTALLRSDSLNHDIQVLMMHVQLYLLGMSRLDEWARALPVLCRNTLSVWSVRSLMEHGGFDPRCSVWGGQEDTAMLIQLLISCGFNPAVANLDRVVRYSDPRTLTTDPEQVAAQIQKIEREWEATQSMLIALKESYSFHDPTSVFKTTDPDFEL